MSGVDLAAWADTSFGDDRTWSPALRVAAGLCLAYPTACALVWGERNLMMYNDEYATLLGDRHPLARGHAAWDVLPDMWATVGPILSGVVATGQAHCSPARPLPLTTRTGPRIRWYSFAYVPVFDVDATQVVGVFATVTDETQAQVLCQRAAAIESIGRLDPATAATLDSWAVHVVDALEGFDGTRFAVVYALDLAGDTVTRLSGPRGRLRHALSRNVLESATGSAAWPVEQVLRRGDTAPTRLVSRSTTSDLRPFYDGAWLVPLAGPPGTRVLLAVGLDDALLDDRSQHHTVEQVVAAVQHPDLRPHRLDDGRDRSVST